STARTPQQNGVVERRNRTLVEAARTMIIFSKSPMFLWVEVVATACYTQNRSLIHTRYNKTPYELLRDRTPELKYLYVFGALSYPKNDFEDIGKLKPKANIGIFYSPSNKDSCSTRLPTSAKPSTKNDWDLLLQPMFDEYFKPPSVVSTPISPVTLLPPDTAGASSFSTSIDKDAPSPKFDSDTFKNPFAHPDTSSAESSSRIVDTSNMHTFQLPLIYTKRWTKYYPFTTIIGDPSKHVSTRRQLSTDALWCYFHAFLAKAKPKNYKEAMEESCWIEAIQEEIHEFERLEV
ncbi:retrovirus-related pol polyprotein from transposon TNT 1-94, partial [Tanacetum coccineum]